MFAALRQRLIQRWFGDGLAGAMFLALGGWAWRQFREGLRHEPELLDVSTLKPGETYTITTRPAPSRRERKIAKRADAARTKAERATRTTRAQRKTGRALERARRKAGKAKPGSVAQTEQSARVSVLEQRAAALGAYTAKQQRLVDNLATLEAELRAEQDARLAAARKHVPPARRRTWQS